MDPSKYLEAAERIVESDGAEGVAQLMADHERLLQHLRAIYDEGSPGSVAKGSPDAAIQTMRDLALSGLKLPDELKAKLSTSGKPATTEGEAERIVAEVSGDEAIWDWRVSVHVEEQGRPGGVRDLEFHGHLQAGNGTPEPGHYGMEACCRALFGAAGQVAIKGESWGKMTSHIPGFHDRMAMMPTLTPLTREGATEESAEAAAKRIAGELAEEKSRVVEVERKLDRRNAYAQQLADTVATFRSALLDGPLAAPWWVTATHALDEMGRLTAGEEPL